MSSYEKNNYEDLFKTIVFLTDPKKIVEFGILKGYSLMSFVNSANKDCYIYGYDIFDEFNGNHADKNHLLKIFEKYENVKISYGNFYQKLKEFEDESIDILHIDIANDGDVYKYAVEVGLKKITKKGMIILEGGSKERDNVEWMTKYNKKSIKEYLDNINIEDLNGISCVKNNNIKILCLEKYPSVTIITYI